MTKIVGIRFRTAGKIYYFDPADFDLDMAMHVIVETARGIEMGTVLIPPKEVDDDKVVSPLKPVIRVATDEDEKTVERNKEKRSFRDSFKCLLYAHYLFVFLCVDILFLNNSFQKLIALVHQAVCAKYIAFYLPYNALV